MAPRPLTAVTTDSSGPTLGVFAEIKVRGHLIKHAGRVPLTGSYEDLRQRAVAFVHRTWPYTEDRPIHRIVWQP